jgi:hypothetical protein
VAFGRVHKLRNQGKEEGCCLRVQRLDQHSFTKRTPRPDWWCRGSTIQTCRRVPAGGLKSAKAEPN